MSDRSRGRRRSGSPGTAYQYAAVVVSGVLAGLGGAQLALGNVVQFSENMIVRPGLDRRRRRACSAGPTRSAFSARACCSAPPRASGSACRATVCRSQITDALPFVVTLIALAVARRHFKRVLELTAA